MRIVLGMVAAAVMSIGVAFPAVTTEAGCTINVGRCTSGGNCTVNYGTCDAGGRCTVSIGHCGDGDTRLVAL